MKQLTIKARLKAMQPGEYTYVVLEDLNQPFDSETKLIMAVIFPNWKDVPEFKINDTGYFKLEFVESGKSTWYNEETKEHIAYKNTNYVFYNYIKDDMETCLIEKFNF